MRIEHYCIVGFAMSERDDKHRGFGWRRWV